MFEKSKGRLRGRVLKGSAVLSAGEAAAYGCSFLRNMILARLLTKADYGVAAALSLVISMLEFTGKMAVSQLVVQDKEGDRPEFMATAHLVQFVVALVSACTIVAASGLLSRMLKMPDQRWAIQALALIPLFKGLENLDVRRRTRELHFTPAAILEAGPQLVITLMAWPLGVYFHDYRAIVCLLLVRGFMTLAGSHLLAERSYAWGADPAVVRRTLGFGLPLLLNSLLVLAILQGDQWFVNGWFTKADLASYANAATLTLGPAVLFLSVIGSVVFPLMAKVQDNPAAFARYYGLCIKTMAAFAAFSGMFLIVGGEALMRLVFGRQYIGGGLVLAWLAAGNAFRLLRAAPTTAALARADTRNQLYSNFWRSVGLGLAFLAASHRQPIWMVAAAGVVGEAVAFTASFLRLRRVGGLALSQTLQPALYVAVVVSAGGVLVLLGLHEWPARVALLVAWVLCCAAGAGCVWVFADLRAEVLRVLGDGWRMGSRFVQEWRQPRPAEGGGAAPLV